MNVQDAFTIIHAKNSCTHTHTVQYCTTRRILWSEAYFNYRLGLASKINCMLHKHNAFTSKSYRITAIINDPPYLSDTAKRSP